MLQDEAVYADPESFDPERFMKRDGCTIAPDPARAAFGFGRR